MAEIDATTVKALREATGQGMMDCKKALQEADGDLEAAQDILRKKGLATAEKKSARPTSEGLVAVRVADDGGSAAMVEVQCETDFCARNDEFRSMVQQTADMALEAGQDGPVEPTEAMQAAVQATLAKINENMSLARAVKLSADRVGAYVHHNGKVGVLVGVEGELSDETLNDLCMHIAFADPVGVTTEDVPAEMVEKEKQFASEEAADSGKPPEIVEKIVTGKVQKFLASNALLEQPFVRDDKKKVKDILGDARVTAFARFAVGG
jgi:elongation factor Ts